MDHTVEEGFSNLEEIVKSMEQNDISLEASFELYQKGIEELKYLNEKIKATEKAILEIKSNGTVIEFNE